MRGEGEKKNGIYVLRAKSFFCGLAAGENRSFQWDEFEKGKIGKRTKI